MFELIITDEESFLLMEAIRELRTIKAKALAEAGNMDKSDLDTLDTLAARIDAL